MEVITIGNRQVGTGKPCFVVFEAGPTIYDFESGKKLCKAAANAGADAIKFQIMDVDRLMGDKSGDFTYGTASGDVKEKLYDILKRRELPLSKWKKLKEYCDSLGILFFSTAMFPEEVLFLKEIGACAIKIAAGDINHTYLIEYSAKSGLPVILDARGTQEDLDCAVKACRQNGNDSIMIMHCPPGYPCKDSDINLSALPELKKRHRCPIGFSDHSLSGLMNYASLGYGADCVEKTITLDRSTRSAEHYMSLEPHELKPFVDDIRRIEKARGSPDAIFIYKIGLGVRRSLAAKRGIKKGQALREEDLDFRRPGLSIPADRWKEIIGKKAKKDIAKGEFLKEDML